jgi:hypothetical protein
MREGVRAREWGGAKEARERERKRIAKFRLLRSGLVPRENPV